MAGLTLQHSSKSTWRFKQRFSKCIMPRSKEIPEDVKEKIIFYHKSGKGYKAISKMMGLHRSTVRTIISKWKTLGTVMNLPRSGRPTKISPRTQRKIIQEVTKKPEITSKELQASLASAKIKVHDSTIRRRLGQIRKREIVSKRKTLQKTKRNACALFENNLQEDSQVNEENLLKTEVAEVEVFI